MLTVQTMRRLEVWSDLACRGGVRLGVLRDVSACLASVVLGGVARLTTTVTVTDPAYSVLVPRAVLRAVQDDTTFDEWRITGFDEDSAAGLAQLTAEPADVDLGTATLVGQTDGDAVVRYDFAIVGLTPTQILDTYVLPALSAAGLSWVARGTVDPVAPIDLSLEWDSPLAVLTKILDKTTCEFQFRRNGTAGYYLDLVTAIGASAGTCDVRYRKNLTALKRSRTATGQVTRVYPRGASEDGYRATMAGARWQVSGVAGSVVSLVDPVGGDGPVQFAGQLVGLYLKKASGATTAISASAVTSSATSALTVASVSGVSVGDFVEIVATSTSVGLTFLDSPADLAAYGVVAGALDRGDIPSTVNLVPNPAGRAWPSGTLPTGWALVASGGSPTTAKETSGAFTQLGGASVKVTATAAGQGVLTPAGVLAPTALRPYGSGFARVLVASGQVRVELVLTKADASTVVIPTTGVATSQYLSQWENIGVSGEDLNALGAVSAVVAVAVRVVAHGGAAVFYVDAVQATNTAAQMALVEGSGAVQLWQAANEQLRTNGGPTTTFDVALADLYRLDGTTWAESKVELGGGIRVTDPRLAAAPANLAPSPTLMTDANADGIADGWSATGGGSGYVGTRSIDATEAAQKLAVTTGPSVPTTFGILFTSAAGSVLPGDIVEFAVDVKTAALAGGGVAAIYGNVLTSGGTELVNANVSSTATAWTTLRVRAVAPATASKLSLAAYFSGGSASATGTVWFRNASVRILNRSGAFVTRVVGVDRDYRIPGLTRVILSTKPDDLSGALARPARRARPIETTSELPDKPPLPPTATITTSASSLTSVTVALAAALGQRGIGPMEYRSRVVRDDTATDYLTGWSAWASTSGLPTTLVVARLGARSQVVQLEVRDTGAGNIVGGAEYVVGPRLESVDPGTGQTVQVALTPAGSGFVGDNTVIFRAAVQSSPTGSSLGAGKRMELKDGSLVLRVDSTGTEGTKMVVGDYSVTIGGGTASRTSALGSSNVDSAGSGGDVWVTGAASTTTIPNAGGQLPAYDGNYRLAGTLRADLTTKAVAFTKGTSRLRLRTRWSSSSTWTDHGIVATTPDLTSANSAGDDTATPLAVTIAPSTRPGTDDLLVEATLEVRHEDHGTGFAGSTVTASVTSFALGWTQQTSGTTQTRRGVYHEAESGKPMGTWEGLASDPSTTTLREGDWWYDKTTHVLKYYNGTAIKTVTAT